MSLLTVAKEAIERITANTNGFAVEITFTSQNGEDTATITGLHTKHHTAIDPTNGNLINSKNAHISFSESYLTDVDYPVRNVSGELVLRNHRVSVADSTGTVKEYLVRENFADETVGFILCMLQDFEV